jgi:AsmA protein
MQKILRYLFIGLGSLVVLLVAVVVIFIAVFDANAYKQDLSNLVQRQTGRELQFQGDVSLTLYPSLGMKLGAMTFANAPGFGDLPMLRIREASVSVDVASLFRLAPEIDKLILRDLEINLIRNKVGVNNWDDLVAPGAGAAGASSGSSATAAAPSSASGSKPASGDFELKGAFAGLDIQNLKLLWLDEQAGSRYQVTDLDISTGRIAPNESFPLTLHVDANNGAGDKVRIDLGTNVEYLIEQQRLSLNDIKLALNEFAIGGKVQVSNFNKPALRFDLASLDLDVDALLGTPPAEPAAAPSGGTGAGAGTGEDTKIELPMQVLRDLDIDGELRIAKVKVQNLRMQDVDLRVNAQKGLVALKPVQAKIYDGQVVAKIAVDVNANLPRYGVINSLQGVQIGDLLKDYMGESPISGKLNADVNLSTSGEWLSKLKQNSNGTMKLAFLDGALNGFNIRQSIDVAKAKLKGDKPPPQETLKTDFSSLTISGVIADGVFSSDDLDLQAPLLRIGGKGMANLNSELIDYRVDAKLVGTLKGQQGDSADQLAGLTIPVRIKGPFTAPEIDVLLDDLLKARMAAEKAKLKAEVDAKKAKLEAEARAKQEKLRADIEAQKQAVQAQLRAEQQALEEAKKRELEKKIEVEKARAAKNAKEKLQKLMGN